MSFKNDSIRFLFLPTLIAIIEALVCRNNTYIDKNALVQRMNKYIEL